MPTVSELLDEIEPIGLEESGGYRRHLFTEADAALRAWFVGHAERLGLRVEQDRNLNLWAYWDAAPDARVVVTGSHLDSVPGGGAFDGPLGVASALRAVELLRAAGWRPTRKTVAVAVFAEEEGGGFGVPCIGSRLMTGITEPVALRERTDVNGVRFADAARAAGADIEALGPDLDRLDTLDSFVELHVEQGRYLADLTDDTPLATATQILAHGRWRIDIVGEGNHAGTTPMTHRHDPMVAAARIVLAATESAVARPPARATVGRILAHPGGVNVIASRVQLWVDARAETAADVASVVAEVERRAAQIAADAGCRIDVTRESFSPATFFDSELTARVEDAIGRDGRIGRVPRIATGAGHDAAVLADAASARPLPTAMIFVRNPTGVSHAPAESSTAADSELGAEALARVLQELAS